MIVRQMEPREIDLVVNLFNYYREEADIPNYDENRVLTTVREYNIRPHLFFKILVHGQRPVGLIGGFLSEDPVESEVVGTIQFNYIIPEHATEQNYQLLITEFESWAQSVGAEQIRALDIGRNIQRLESVYDAIGFTPVRVTIMNKELA